MSKWTKESFFPKQLRSRSVPAIPKHAKSTTLPQIQDAGALPKHNAAYSQKATCSKEETATSKAKPSLGDSSSGDEFMDTHTYEEDSNHLETIGGSKNDMVQDTGAFKTETALGNYSSGDEYVDTQQDFNSITFRDCMDKLSTNFKDCMDKLSTDFAGKLDLQRQQSDRRIEQLISLIGRQMIKVVSSQPFTGNSNLANSQPNPPPDSNTRDFNHNIELPTFDSIGDQSFCEWKREIEQLLVNCEDSYKISRLPFILKGDVWDYYLRIPNRNGLSFNDIMTKLDDGYGIKLNTLETMDHLNFVSMSKTDSLNDYFKRFEENARKINITHFDELYMACLYNNLSKKWKHFMANFPKDDYRRFVNQAYMCERNLKDDDDESVDETDGVNAIANDRFSRPTQRRSFNSNEKLPI